MARWFVVYSRREEGDAVCFRVFPEGEPERWVVQTNPALPREVQEEMALQIAELLSDLLGI